jgi:hypothetical protein
MGDFLELFPALRAVVKLSGGAYKSERHFLNFVVNGDSLWERVGQRHDMVTVLHREFATEERCKAVHRLLLTEDDFPDDRRSVFICSECGDLKYHKSGAGLRDRWHASARHILHVFNKTSLAFHLTLEG